MKNKLNHIGFIMDGNGRWAQKNKKERNYGHSIGAKKIEEVIKWCIDENIKVVSLYAFSVENWTRPEFEVNFLMKLLLNHITNLNINSLNERGIRFIWTGNENNLNIEIINALKKIQNLTKNNNLITINLLFNYGSQQEIINCINDILEKKQELNLENINLAIDPYNFGPLDLIIRTSGEQRLSNFMLWQASYAELIFSKLNWPEYNYDEFKNNLNEFYLRKRKFGNIN